MPDELKRERLERVTEVQGMVTAERYERQLGRVVPAIIDRVTEQKTQARTYAQADDIDGVTLLHHTMGFSPGDIIDVRLEAVVNDCDFEATLVRRVSTPSVPRATMHARALPVMSSVGAFGR